MADLLSFEDFTGASKPTSPTLPDDSGTTRTPVKPIEPATELTFDQFTGNRDKGPSGLSLGTEKVLHGLKAVGGEAAALADFALSLPGFLLGVGGQLGGTISAAARGVPLTADPRQLNPVTAYTVGRETGQTLSEPFMNPIHKLLQMVDSGDAYEHAKTTEGMSWLTEKMDQAGQWVEQKTNGAISRDAIPMLLETTMAASTGIGAKGKPAIDPVVTRRMRAAAEELKQRAEVEAENATLTPEEFAARTPVQQQINDLLGIRTPQEQARITRARRKDVQIALKTPEQGGDYGDIAESQFRAEERLRNEQAYREQQVAQEPQGQPLDTEALAASPERIGQAEILRILQKPGYERTAEDLITLREARKQGGKASPEALMLLGAAGIGAAAGATLSDDKLRGAVLGGTLGLGAALPFIGRGRSVPRSFGQGGAVKGPGGMWHPEAVERLAKPLKEKLYLGDAQRSTLEPGVPLPTEVWSDRAVRNYLNKYAGTERDPLKDVEIPFGEGTRKWGEVTDSVIKSKPEFVGPEGKEKLEPVYAVSAVHGLGGYVPAAMGALTDYLSHVGDYLRQNVKPEDLQKYDLVRAVKETAKKDAEMAKQMEKAQAASTKELPVYKEYPDGFKWVELKLPEKLTEEQAKSVRKVVTTKGEELQGGDPFDMPEYLPKGTIVYEALGHDGKPIRNSYTGEVAKGPTPEEAWLAGRLAEEGNQMGHCVGGYCPSVASGESRIFSLRDPKGKSHVTVEVEPAGAKPLDPVGPEKDAIVQIKGKQNRAPNAEYLPYVQDFVKSREWGDVGDLHHAGLVDASALRREANQYGDTSTLDYLDRFPGQRYVPPKPIEMDKFMPRGERGAVDQKLVVGLGALGLGGLAGALATDNDPSAILLSALAGFALTLPGAKEHFNRAVKSVDYGLGSLSTRIGNISPALKLKGREFERRVLTRAHSVLHQVAPFMAELQKLPKAQREELSRAILTNDRERIAALMRGNAPLTKAFAQTRSVLQDLGEQLRGRGRFKTMLEDYFPRLVKDVEGLKKALDLPDRTRLEQTLMEADRESVKKRGTPLTQVERSSIINREIQAIRKAKGYLPGFAKRRGVDEITAKLQPFYYTPQESLYAYVRGAVRDLEMAHFFGKDLAQTRVAGQEHINVETSIGNIVGRELAEGRINHAQAQELIDMLKSRFQGGDRAASPLVQDVKNLANMGLLGNVVSAATQMGDTAIAIYMQGLRPSLTAIARQLSGREKITTADFGLSEHIAEEFVSRTRTANWLNSMFKYSGFSWIDRFGKETSLNAALIRYEKLSRSPKGIAEIARKYERAYGDEFPQLVSDLKNNRLTERVRSLLFSELSDVQPISKLEMPQAYLDHPNGRLMYMLKTFMLKQVDLMRRDAYNEIKAGNVARGLKNLTSYAVILGLSGATTQMIQDWLLGRPTHMDAYDIMENALKTFGWSTYTRAEIAKGHPVQAVINAFAPPWKIMDDIISRNPRAVQYVPLVGKIYYNWELGGKERAEIARSRQTGSRLSAGAKAYERAKRAKRTVRRYK